MATRMIELESMADLMVYDLNWVHSQLMNLYIKSYDYDEFCSRLNSLADDSAGKILYEHKDMLYPYLSNLTAECKNIMTTVNNINYSGIMTKFKEENLGRINIKIGEANTKINQYRGDIAYTNTRKDLDSLGKTYTINNINSKIEVVSRDKKKLEKEKNEIESHDYGIYL